MVAIKLLSKDKGLITALSEDSLAEINKEGIVKYQAILNNFYVLDKELKTGIYFTNLSEPSLALILVLINDSLTELHSNTNLHIELRVKLTLLYQKVLSTLKFKI